MLNYDGRLDDEKTLKPLLVTGGAGFIGSMLCFKLLNKGYKVHCLDNFSNSNIDNIKLLLRNKNFSYEDFDCSNYYESKSNFDAVFNLAGLVGFPKCSQNETLSYLWNIKIAINMTEYCKNTGAKLIHSSTGSVYGSIDGICTENSPTNPVSVYGRDKLISEDIIRSYSGSISLRFATGFGLSYSHREDLLPNTFIKDAINNKCLSIFEPHAKRTFISVDQMAEAFVYFYENYNKSNKQVYNIGDESLNLSKLELAQIVKSVYPCEIQYIEGKDPDLRDYKVDYSRAKDFGFVVKNDMLDEILILKKYYGK